MSEFKEKKEAHKPFDIKKPLKMVKHFFHKTKGSKDGSEDPQQPPAEQKSPLLMTKVPSDEMAMDESNVAKKYGTKPHPYLETETPTRIDSSVNIELSNGRKVSANEGKRKGYFQRPKTPTSTTGSRYESSPIPYEDPPIALPPEIRTVFGPTPTTSSIGYESPNNNRSKETAQEKATYDSLLAEAQTLRRDLEKEFNLNRGSKEELERKITDTKLQMAAKKQEPSAEKVYDEIIVTLSQELTDLETKVRQIEARMRPLDRAIIDLKDIEDFITDREMDTEGASELFETIMSNMLKDINLGQTFAGETPIAGRLPRNVMDEMQGKMLSGALPSSDYGSQLFTDEFMETQAGNEFEDREKLTTGSSDNYHYKKNRSKLARVSRKLSNVTEFTQSAKQRNPGRSPAFRFNAVERSDAFKNVDYMPPGFDPNLYNGISIGIGSYAQSAASDKMSTTELQKVGEETWVGFEASETGPMPPLSDVPSSLPGSKSVADLKDLEKFPGVGDDTDKQADADKEAIKTEDESKPAQSEETKIPKSAEPAAEKDVEKEENSLASQLANAKLKKAEEREPEVSGVPPSDLSPDDFAKFSAIIMGPAKPPGEGKVGVQMDLKVEEPPPPPKVEEKKPPPPPPKKTAPPPPPPPTKKSVPPPPPGKKAGAKGKGPPPPPGKRNKDQGGLQRAPEVIAMFQEMRKALLGDAAKASGGPKKVGGDGPADPAALMAELAKNSKYQAQVQNEVMQYGSEIEVLIKEVSTFEAADMKELIEFVKRVDDFLNELTDETAVLKHFEWPNRWYSMLEAKALYEELEKMKKTFKPWVKSSKTNVEELKKIQKFMDKSKTRVDIVMRTKDQDEKKFKDSKIPWNPKIFNEVKIASLTALVAYMEIVLEEVDIIQKNAPAEQSKERNRALDKAMGHLTGAINFAFRAHQFAGGFTPACNERFSEIAAKTRQLKSEIAGAAS